MHGLADVKFMEEILTLKWNIEGSLTLQWSIKGILTLKWNISGILHIKMKYKWRIGHHTPSYEMQNLMAWDWQVMSYPNFYILIPSCSKAVIWKVKCGKAIQCNFDQSNSIIKIDTTGSNQFCELKRKISHDGNWTEYLQWYKYGINLTKVIIEIATKFKKDLSF
jgi:hypothetical protein